VRHAGSSASSGAARHAVGVARFLGMLEAGDPADLSPGPQDRGRGPGRARRAVTRGRVWVETERTLVVDSLEERRKRGGVVAAGFDVQDFDSRVGGGILAGAVAFRVFLFLVPFVYVVFTVLDLAAKTLNQDPAHLAKSVGITGVLASAVVNTQSVSVWQQLVLVVGATVAMVITARSLTKALYVVHWLVWRIDRVRPVGSAPFLTVIGVTFLLTAFGILINRYRSSSGLVGAIVSLVVISAASFGIWLWISRRLPHAAAPLPAFIPGAILFAIGMDVLHLLTTYWIGHLVARKTNLYGVLGVAVAVLFWVYVLGRITVGSVGLNAALWFRRNPPTDDPQAAASESLPPAATETEGESEPKSDGLISN
jgi:uncharacterized BrkB/YihY/UPF0761 family membrane protein